MRHNAQSGAKCLLTALWRIFFVYALPHKYVVGLQRYEIPGVTPNYKPFNFKIMNE